MRLIGETELALIDKEKNVALNWSALNLVVCSLANRGFRSPIELEDIHGEIKTTLEPGELSQLTEHLAENGEEIARESDGQDWRERIKTFTSSRETVTFVMSALRLFRECVRDNRSLVVEEVPPGQINITPEPIEEAA